MKKKKKEDEANMSLIDDEKILLFELHTLIAHKMAGLTRL